MKKITTLAVISTLTLVSNATTFIAFNNTGVGGNSNDLTTRTSLVDVDADGVVDFEFTWNQTVTLSAGVSDANNLFTYSGVGETVDVEIDFASFSVTSLNSNFINESVAFDSWREIRVSNVGAQFDVSGTTISNSNANGSNDDIATPVDASLNSYTITSLTEGATRSSGGNFNFAITFDTVPEPSSAALLGLGALALLARRKR